MMHTMRHLALGLRARCLAEAGALRAAALSLAASGEADAPAWRLGSRAPPLAECMLHVLLLLLMHSVTATIADALSPERGIVARVSRPLSAPERAHLTDTSTACDALQAFLSRAQSALAQLRLGGGTAYLDGAAAVLEQASALAAGVVTSNSQRIAAFGGGGRASRAVWSTTFCQHAAAVAVLQPREAMSLLAA
jgi:hypothetical protein